MDPVNCHGTSMTLRMFAILCYTILLVCTCDFSCGGETDKVMTINIICYHNIIIMIDMYMCTYCCGTASATEYIYIGLFLVIAQNINLYCRASPLMHVVVLIL